MRNAAYQSLLADPDLYAAVRAAAHRERAREVERLVFAPVRGFFTALLNGSIAHMNPDIRRA